MFVTQSYNYISCRIVFTAEGQVLVSVSAGLKGYWFGEEGALCVLLIDKINFFRFLLSCYFVTVGLFLSEQRRCSVK